MQRGSAQRNSVIDLSAYRKQKDAVKYPEEPEEDDEDARKTIEEIAHHLLMAVRAIKRYRQ